jgi:hypothetical protein
MKTADSIEQQEERKSARDNGESLREMTQPVKQKQKRGDASYTARIAPWKWQPGKSANPGGRPKHDLAAEIARAVFERNAEALYKAYTKAALKGNAYAFKELADRAFGKLKERHEVEVSQYRELTDEQLLERVHQLEAELGIQRAVPEILPPADPKPN